MGEPCSGLMSGAGGMGGHIGPDGSLGSQFSDLGPLGVRMGVGQPQSHHCRPLACLSRT